MAPKKRLLAVILALFAAAFALAPVAAFAEDATAPVASIGETNYATLQDAVDAVADGQTITLLADATECVAIEGHTFTLDLNGKALKNSADDNTLLIKGAANVTLISNGGDGTVESIGGNDAIQMDGSASLTINSGVSAYADTYAYRAVSLWSVDNTLVIDGASVVSEKHPAIFLAGGSLTVNSGSLSCSQSSTQPAILAGGADGKHFKLKINGGTIGSPSLEDGEALGAVLYSGDSLSITGGDFYGEVEYEAGSDDVSAVVSGGTYGEDGIYYISQILEEGKAFLVNKQGRIEVVDLTDAKARASRVVRVTSAGVERTAYFEDATAAQSYYDEASQAEGVTSAIILSIYRVTFETKGATVSTVDCEQGEALGTLPEAGTYDGYDFVGWYVNGTYADAYKATDKSVPASDLTVKSLWRESATGTVTDDPKLAVAKIGETRYETLQAAIDAVQDGQTITLVDDVYECDTASAHTFTLDLNGKTLTNEGGNTALSVNKGANVTLKGGSVVAPAYAHAILIAGGSLTIEDGVTVTSGDDAWSPFYLSDGGSLTINGGTYSSEDEDVIAAYEGTVTINGGTFSGSSDDVDYYIVYACPYGKDQVNLAINGGSFSAVGGVVYAYGNTNAVINDGDFASEKYFALETRYSTVAVNGGAFTTKGGSIASVSSSFSSLTINGGTFGDTSAESGVALCVTSDNKDGSLSITGGDFYGKVEHVAESDDVSAVVSGGTFSSYADKVVSGILAEGKTLLYNAQRRYEVVDEIIAKKTASYVVRFTDANGAPYAFYFADEDGAHGCYEWYDVYGSVSDLVLHQIFHVTFETKGEPVATADCEEGESVGELPEAGSVEGYDFVGWYVDGKYADENKVTADYVPTSDVTVKSLWLEKGSSKGDEPTDEPSGKGGKSDESDDKGSDKVMPQTGDVVSMAAGVAAAGAALAGVGAIRRRK